MKLQGGTKTLQSFQVCMLLNLNEFQQTSYKLL